MKNSSIRRNVTRAAATLAIGGAAAATFVAPANAASTDTWNKLAYCESGGNWAIDNGNGFSGGLQFVDSTWAAYGGTQYAARASQASAEQQIAVAERVLADVGWGAWPACSAKLGLYGSGETGNANATAAASATTTEVTTQAETVAPVEETTQEAQAPVVQEAPATEEAPATVEAPAATTTEAPAATTTGTTYTVVAGDTLSEISVAHGIYDWSKVAEANKETVPNPDIIEIGQVLVIPAA